MMSYWGGGYGGIGAMGAMGGMGGMGGMGAMGAMGGMTAMPSFGSMVSSADAYGHSQPGYGYDMSSLYGASAAAQYQSSYAGALGSMVPSTDSYGQSGYGYDMSALYNNTAAAAQYPGASYNAAGGMGSHGYGQAGYGYDMSALYNNPTAAAAFSSSYTPGYTPQQLSQPEPTTEQQANAALHGPEIVEKLLDDAFGKLEAVGNQLLSAAQEFEDVRAEVVMANNVTDAELRTQLQESNNEIYKLRGLLQEAAERKANPNA